MHDKDYILELSDGTIWIKERTIDIKEEKYPVDENTIMTLIKSSQIHLSQSEQEQSKLHNEYVRKNQQLESDIAFMRSQIDKLSILLESYKKLNSI